MTRSDIRVVCFLGAQALGDFVMQSLAAASVAASLGGARLGVIYRNDRPYKAPLVAMMPSVAATLALPANPGVVLPLDWFDPQCDATRWPDAWRALGLDRPDVLLMPGMLDIGAAIPPIPGLSIPPAMAAGAADALCRLGLERDRWFACIHMRQLGYVHRHRIDPHRCVEPRSYLPMIRTILSEQGGQVVRLGDPSMTPLPRLPGLIDLSGLADSFVLQAFAASRARYFIGTDTGATQLAGAFRTPSASTNALGLGLWNDGDVILPKTMHLEDGRPMTVEQFIATGMLSIHHLRPDGRQFIDNTPQQLVDVSRHMYRITADCAGWRETTPVVAPGSRPTVHLPLVLRDIAEEIRLTWWTQ